jgi:hypothetical protein
MDTSSSSICVPIPINRIPLLAVARQAEQWIKDGKRAVKMTRLSCHRFCGNEVRLWLSILAYNWETFGGSWRCPSGSSAGRCPACNSAW